MASSIYVLKYSANPKEFAEAFFSSNDFEMGTLKAIARYLDIKMTGRTKNELISIITQRINFDNISRYSTPIIEQLVARPRDAISMKIGKVKKFPQCGDPSELITQDGSEIWYGPVRNPDDSDDASWYIRPQFIDYWDTIEKDDTPRLFKARWLCFARVTQDSISLHWKGFTYPQGPDAVKNNARNVQFPYWNYIPLFFEEIEEYTAAKLEYVKLHDLLLYHLWDKYLDDKDTSWTHSRIRAESGGVSLNAHAGVSDNEINVGGILKLASTLRTAMQEELKSEHGINLPNPDHFDNTILRTLIREFGALSYGFCLKRWGQVVFNAHSYFGHKPGSKSPDSFAHMQITYKDRNALDQLNFILLHSKDMMQVGNSESRTVPVLQ